MKLWRTILSAIKYLASARERKLYRQWVEMAELPPENIVHEEVRESLVQERQGREERFEMHAGLKPPLELKTLFLMQGASLVLVTAILVLLIVQSC
ncbi:hypothetical protein ACFLRP_05275 [Bacteroidota bacterium]